MPIEKALKVSLAKGLLAVLTFVQATLSAETLSPLIERTQFEEAFEKGNVAPKWSGGVLLTWKPHTDYADDRPNLRVNARDGKVVGRYRVWLADATVLYIRDAAATEDGGIAAVGNAETKSGVMIGYLATIAKGSSVVKVIVLAPFEGEKIAISPDKSLWILGYQTDEERKLLKSTPHAPLHHYSAGGELLGKHLQWPEISCGSHPFLANNPLLTASAGRVGVYLSACQSWLDLNSTGEVASRRVVKLPEGYSAKSTFWNALMLEDGRVYAFVSHPNHVTPNGSTVHSGLFVLRREQGSWESVDKYDAEMAAGSLGWLAGMDRNRFVYRVGNSEVVWLSLLPQ